MNALGEFCSKEQGRGHRAATEADRMAEQGQDLRNFHCALGSLAGELRHPRFTSAIEPSHPALERRVRQEHGGGYRARIRGPCRYLAVAGSIRSSRSESDDADER